MIVNGSNNEDQLRTLYRKLQGEAERLTSQNPERAKSLRAQANRVMNKLQILRQQGPSFGNKGYRFA